MVENSLKIIRSIYFSQIHIPLILIFWASPELQKDSYILALSAWLVYLLDPLLSLTSNNDDLRYKPIRTEFVNQHRRFYYVLAVLLFLLLFLNIESFLSYQERNPWVFFLFVIYYTLRIIKPLQKFSLFWKPIFLTLVWSLALQSLMLKPGGALFLYIYFNTLCFELRDTEFSLSNEFYYSIAVLSAMMLICFPSSLIIALFFCSMSFAWAALWNRPEEWRYIILLDYPLFFFPFFNMEKN